MTRIVAALTGLLALLSLTACVTEMGGVKPSIELTSVDEATAGHVLLLIGAPRSSPFITWGLTLQHLQTAATVDVTFDGRGLSLGTKADYNEDDLEGAAYLVTLPPGDYAIMNYGFFFQTMPGSYANYRPTQPFAIPFRVITGKTTYLGNFTGMPGRRALIGWSSIHGAYWWVRDRQDPDVAIAQRKWPGKNFDAVINAVPDLAAAPAPGFLPARLEP